MDSKDILLGCCRKLLLDPTCCEKYVRLDDLNIGED